MPRKHIHVLGTAYRRNYSNESMENALRDLVENNLSLMQAAERHGVPRATLYKKYRGMHSNRLGKPPAIKPHEEDLIAQAILIAAEYNVPFTNSVLQDFVEQYLNRKGVIISSFRDNRPGKDWCEYLMKRHPFLARRNSENIKRCRADLDSATISDYFEHLTITLDGIDSANIINYDETNITDDPGTEKVFVRRGTKHAHRIMDSSKSSTSIMFAACADGTLLPIYVVYRSKYVYPDWIEGGPEGARYNRTASGWFDADTFEDWFMKVALPFLKRKEGKKVIIGDNLGSHLSYNVLLACEQNNIAFVFLPTNSTHVCQPLDVAVFRPLKRAWKKILTEWKLHNKGVVPKQQFPTLLKQLLESTAENTKNNILAGFKAAGIYPLNPDMVLNKIQPKVANQNINNNAAITEAFSTVMTNLTKTNESNRITRRRKLNVPAGSSVSAADVGVNINAGPSHDIEIDADDAVTENFVPNDDLSDCETENHDENVAPNSHETEDIKMRVIGPGDIDEGCFVLVNFVYDMGKKKQREKTYVAKIVRIGKINIKVSCLRQFKNDKNKFVFPDIEDISTVKLCQIKFKLQTPQIKRGLYTFSSDVI